MHVYLLSICRYFVTKSPVQCFFRDNHPEATQWHIVVEDTDHMILYYHLEDKLTALDNR